MTLFLLISISKLYCISLSFAFVCLVYVCDLITTGVTYFLPIPPISNVSCSLSIYTSGLVNNCSSHIAVSSVIKSVFRDIVSLEFVLNVLVPPLYPLNLKLSSFQVPFSCWKFFLVVFTVLIFFLVKLK